MRKIFIDLGAHRGLVTEDFARNNPSFDIIAIEPNRELLPFIHDVSLRLSKPISVIWGAAWTFDGSIDLFMSEHDEASTVLKGEMDYSNHVQWGWSMIDYSKGYSVPSFDFSSWLARNVHADDEVIVKMDIEGAEYAILEKMLADGTVGLMKKLICEWHFDRLPAATTTRHEYLLRNLENLVPIEDWH